MLDYKFQTEAVIKMLKNDLGQIILPTGTGKSKIQSKYLTSMITKKQGFGIYVITTPRILLTNQLMGNVISDLTATNIPIKRITIHSGKEAKVIKDETTVADRKLLSYFESERTTSGKAVLDAVKKAEEEDAPVLICATYHSVKSLYSALKKDYTIDALLCDESQYVVQEDFFAQIEKVKSISQNTFFFTATQKITSSDCGLGHNNEGFYGPSDFFTRTPREMIDQGYIVRPRLHLIDSGATCDEGVVKTIIDAYKEHKGTIEGDPKMLVICNGSAQLGEIVRSKEFKAFARKQGRNFKTFDASSEYGHNVNCEAVKREDFLDNLRDHEGAAIVFHIDMLAEGIDVPSMSAILPLVNLKRSKFLQTLGRVTRLHDDDRAAFVNGDYLPTDLDVMCKPYAYVIVPVFTDGGDDRSAYIHELVNELRDHGFNPAEDVVIRKRKGVGTADPIDLTTAPDDVKPKSMFNMLFTIYHTIEDEKIAGLMASDDINDNIAAVMAF